MSYPTQQDIDAMRAAGYEAATIGQAQLRQKLGERAAALKLAIQLAFADIELGDGTGLHEAQGLDDFAGEQACAAYRAKDEKTDWRRIQVKDINQCYACMSFLDAEGIRFHLPAIMLADLDGQLNLELLSYLTQISVKEEEKYALLNAAQRTIVIDYLNLRLDDEDFSHEWEHIFNALLGYWNQ